MLLLSKHFPSTRTLQCFLAVAQELNFRSAVQLLNMSQSPLSRQVKDLEDFLRVQLINRDTRQVSLTPAGEAFKNETYTFLIVLDAAVLGVTRQFQDAQEIDEVVRIGVTSVINCSLIPGLDDLFNCPDFASGRRLERDLSKNLIERVRRSELDVAIVGDIVAQPSDLSVESVGCEEMIVMLPERHPAARNKRVALNELCDMPLWFSRIDNTAFYDKCERAFKSCGYSAPRRLEPKDFNLLLGCG